MIIRVVFRTYRRNYTSGTYTVNMTGQAVMNTCIVHVKNVMTSWAVMKCQVTLSTNKTVMFNEARFVVIRLC